VLATRLLSQVLENTVFTYAAILAAFLGFTALGGFLQNRFAPDARRALGWLLPAVALGLALAGWILRQTPMLGTTLRAAVLHDGPHTWALSAFAAEWLVTAAVVALVLSRTLFRGPPQPFVMELPSWRWPQPAVVVERVREAAWSFLKNAGTIILAVSIVVWALASYPRNEAAIEAEVAADRAALAARLEAADPQAADREELAAALAALDTPEGRDAARRGAAQRQSFLGRAGRFVEPVVRPLGWDWRLGCAAIASFPAREVVLGTLAVIYNLGDVDPGEEEGSTALVRRLRAARWDDDGRRVFTLPVALSIMVFFALCAQCASTLVTIGRETGSWVWPLVTFGYMTGLAWLAGCGIYQFGSWMGW